MTHILTHITKTDESGKQFVKPKEMCKFVGCNFKHAEVPLKEVAYTI
jgi:hypothetical protein